MTDCDKFLRFVEKVTYNGREVLGFQRINDGKDCGATVKFRGSSYGKMGPERLVRNVKLAFPDVAILSVVREYSASSKAMREYPPFSKMIDSEVHQPQSMYFSAVQRAADMISRNFGTDPKWSRLNRVIWKVIRSADNHMLALSDLDAIAKSASVGSDEVLALLTLLSAPSTGVLRLRFHSTLPGQGEVPATEVVRMLTAWWRMKSVSDDEWNAWASDVLVYWVPALSGDGLEN